MILGFAHLTFHVCQHCFREIRQYFSASLFPSSSVVVPSSVANLYGSTNREQEVILIGKHRDIEIVNFREGVSGCKNAHLSILEVQNLVSAARLTVYLNSIMAKRLRRRLEPLMNKPRGSSLVIRGLYGKRHLWLDTTSPYKKSYSGPFSMGFYVSRAFDFAVTDVNETIVVQGNHFQIGFEEGESINLEFIRKLA